MSNETQKKISPDDLLVNIGKSIMFKAMLWSIIGHIVFTGVTSISLWTDWATDWERFGLKAPGTINAIKGEDRKIAEEKKRKEEAAAKAEAEAKAAAEKAEKEAKAKAPAGAAPAAPAAAGTTNAPAAAATTENGEKKPPEVQPLPPKKNFELGDDLSLD